MSVNGFFFCFPLVSTGYLIRKNINSICNIKTSFIAISFLFFFMLMIMEKMFIISTGINALDMSFFLLPTSIMLFVLTLRHITNTFFDNYGFNFHNKYY